MHVREPLLSNVLYDIAVVLVNVGGVGALEEAEWGETDSNAVGPNGSDDSIDYFKDNATAVLGAATVSVSADVDVVRDKLIEEVTVCAVLCSGSVSAWFLWCGGKSLQFQHRRSRQRLHTWRHGRNRKLCLESPQRSSPWE